MGSCGRLAETLQGRRRAARELSQTTKLLSSLGAKAQELGSHFSLNSCGNCDYVRIRKCRQAPHTHPGAPCPRRILCAVRGPHPHLSTRRLKLWTTKTLTWIEPQACLFSVQQTRKAEPENMLSKVHMKYQK